MSSSGGGAILSSLPITTISALLAHPIAEKLSRDNFNIWQAQVLPAVRGAQLLPLLEGKIPEPPATISAADSADPKRTTETANPDHATWLAQDQLLLGYLTNTMTREFLAQVARCTTSAQV